MIGDRDGAGLWTLVESCDVFREVDSHLTVRRDVIVRADALDQQDTASRLIVEHPGSVVVLAMDERGRVVCLRQYRHALRRECIELPAGIRDVSGEDPLVTAQRELREEAGFIAGRWELFFEIFASPGWTNEAVQIYLATELTEVVDDDCVRQHEEADLEVLWVPVQELLAAILDGSVTNSQLMIAVMGYQLRAPCKGQRGCFVTELVD